MRFPSSVFDFQFFRQLTAGKLSTNILIVDSGDREAAYATANLAAVSSAKKMCCGASLHGPHIAMEPTSQAHPCMLASDHASTRVSRCFESKTTHRLPDRRRLTPARNGRTSSLTRTSDSQPREPVRTWCARVPIHASTGLTLQSGVPHTVHAQMAVPTTFQTPRKVICIEPTEQKRRCAFLAHSCFSRYLFAARSNSTPKTTGVELGSRTDFSSLTVMRTWRARRRTRSRTARSASGQSPTRAQSSYQTTLSSFAGSVTTSAESCAITGEYDQPIVRRRHRYRATPPSGLFVRSPKNADVDRPTGNWKK
ncbi:hypothetical protein DIPPA_10197 [Diplonema papillatum]|nr:hypothetical protein DIPPA_10197 [Diplonema papillatum]